MKQIRKKGAAATESNKINYAALIAELKATGRKFPANQFGQASLGWVAEQIKCTRDVLRNGSLAEQFKKDIAEIGVCQRSAEPENARLQKKVDNNKKELSAYRKIADEKIAEVEALRTQVQLLTEHIKELELRSSEEDLVIRELLASGRRFFI